MAKVRALKQIRESIATKDGDGVNITRLAGFECPDFSPFLMIDELKSEDSADYIGGFPPHPHRGIETLTYMLNGHFQHKDHMGNVGELRSGGAQWMAAGRGVIHSEMPIMTEGQLHGFQIWINQPAAKKMMPARYHDFQPESITEYRSEQHDLLRVIAGELEVNGRILSGPLTETGVPLTVADWRAETPTTLIAKVSHHFQCMVFVYEGAVSIDGQKLTQGHLGLMSEGDVLKLTASPNCGVLIFAGEPIREPIVHYGPFVMNSVDEINQAINDYNSGYFVD
ncbi:TPA: pirin family protein [Vibrio vulnificus]|nr:pirin family protein [Vibrio vulnificus]HDY8014491.1 pirin family protein [Vibrio vulnificus]